METGDGASGSSSNKRPEEDEITEKNRKPEEDEIIEENWKPEEEEIIEKNKNLSVLVVDDDPVVRRVHDMLLQSIGIKAHVVENGKEAVDLFCIGLSYDLILMDKDMPVMNGIEATKEIRGMGIHSMIVGVTESDVDSEKREFATAGVDYCFQKPLTPERINFILNDLNNF
ncbi:hypothetical protein F3Y22_tig00110324pilonHSYRG00004 [Hibiscus syriacus]|uniref:Response regulatory domain-containing protein n=1 Tax=Hibiscus syriacus TaxID=106335 RepID=A0A6A3B022_HIBSY|nr:two-component response regulator 24-like [Hibiscus syriacus]KAE8710310.1 hypothetical protein F3Y22_tig00110324pilonHSYRG00004 [Hibiscus syriacus]